MEPIDSDLEYAARKSQYDTHPEKRFNWLYIFPVLGVVWLLYLVAAAIFQLPVTGVVDDVMVLMILLLAVMVGLMFWANAPRSHQ
ncbi:MAG TPA: hypothetical protein VHZ51_22500 [Ktedonobacteraceae bacterium]|jgi:hypothetical protein|nr:hypothetical protein [Ktedonobacteraceae bacterium]